MCTPVQAAYDLHRAFPEAKLQIVCAGRVHRPANNGG
ncbi:hypothetical protein KKB_04357 [Kingella kingae PYKK081]|nr:hypothetical protein KKB_04357 [Kingella kingae PYKK081]